MSVVIGSVLAKVLEQVFTTFTYIRRVPKDGRCPHGAAALLEDEDQGGRSPLSVCWEGP